MLLRVAVVVDTGEEEKQPLPDFLLFIEFQPEFASWGITVDLEEASGVVWTLRNVPVIRIPLTPFFHLLLLASATCWGWTGLLISCC